MVDSFNASVVHLSYIARVEEEVASLLLANGGTYPIPSAARRAGGQGGNQTLYVTEELHNINYKCHYREQLLPV